MDNIFPTPEQEAQRAANELYEIKIQVRDLVNKLTQIEKRLKVVAPSIETKKPLKEKQTQKRIFSDQHLKEKYEVLSNKFKDDTTTVLDELHSMDKDELEALVKYLGVSVAKKASQKVLVDMAIGRLKESRLLRSE